MLSSMTLLILLAGPARARVVTPHLGTAAPDRVDAEVAAGGRVVGALIREVAVLSLAGLGGELGGRAPARLTPGGAVDRVHRSQGVALRRFVGRGGRAGVRCLGHLEPEEVLEDLLLDGLLH